MNTIPRSRQKNLSVLIVMLTLATAWALRGRFGHEYGAAWAGSIGVLSLVLVSGRKDWLQNALQIAAIGAVAWGMTGMISYGKVIGYGRSGEWLDASYGLLNLFVIGGLFGFLGGGLTGLMLETSEARKPDWAALGAQMVAGGIVFWGFLIHQLEWFMTPPRSELWAACLGAAFALGWYMKRNGFHNAWFTAMTTMLGAGFGFGFGNFLQVTGIGLGIKINWWNVMEYNIGFWGGLGMAYGIFNRKWPEMKKLSVNTGLWSALLLYILVPVWVISNTFTEKKIGAWAEQFGAADTAAFGKSMWMQVSVVSLIALAFLAYAFRQYGRELINRKTVMVAFAASFAWYQALKLITSGFPGYYRLSMEELTLINIAVILLLLLFVRKTNPLPDPGSDLRLGKSYYLLLVGVLVLLVVLAGITSGWFGVTDERFHRF